MTFWIDERGGGVYIKIKKNGPKEKKKKKAVGSKCENHGD